MHTCFEVVTFWGVALICPAHVVEDMKILFGVGRQRLPKPSCTRMPKHAFYLGVVVAGPLHRAWARERRSFLTSRHRARVSSPGGRKMRRMPCSRRLQRSPPWLTGQRTGPGHARAVEPCVPSGAVLQRSLCINAFLVLWMSTCFFVSRALGFEVWLSVLCMAAPRVGTLGDSIARPHCRRA